jgi:hypothetical protein
LASGGLFEGLGPRLVQIGGSVHEPAGGGLGVASVFERPGWAWSSPGPVRVVMALMRHKVLFCVDGAIDFLFSGRRWPMRPGDRPDLPAGTSHEALAGPAGVTCVEAFEEG